METSMTRRDAHTRVTAWKAAGLRVGFVPTMGALHEGHLALVRESLRATDRTVVSIFVNPLQFGPKEDLAKYPRPIERDRKLLEEAGAHLLYLPDPGEMYADAFETSLVQKRLPAHLCGLEPAGALRGGAHRGAEALQPGPRDGRVLRTEGLPADRRPATHGPRPRPGLSLEIRVCPTVRESDGLAMSSRNAYLSPEHRRAAPVLKRALDSVASHFAAGEHDAANC